jgi:hypothetical protein
MTAGSANENEEAVTSLSPDDRRLRASVLFAVAAESLFIVFLTVFLFNHANPKGDGMENWWRSARP